MGHRIPIVAAVFLAIVSAPTEARDEPELRAFLNKSCIVADEPWLRTGDRQTERSLSIGALVITKVAQALVNRVVTATPGRLSAAGAQKDTHYLSARDFDLYIADLAESPEPSLNPEFGCVTVVAGRFRDESDDCRAAYEPKRIDPATLELPDSQWRMAPRDPGIENVLRRANVCLDEPAASVYEARVARSEDGTAWRLESAGHALRRHIGTSSSRATRNLIYTMEITEPGGQSGGVLLTSAWVNVGALRPGLEWSERTDAGRSDWLRVPEMSRSARLAYEKDTAVHQEVSGEIEALERAVVRDQRMLSALEKRASEASDAVQARLAGDAVDIETRIIRKQAMLDALRAEYADLPQGELRYMPVTIEIGVVESRSERKALGTLAAFVEQNRERIKRVASSAIAIERDFPAPSEEEISKSEQTYYDARVALRLARESGDPAAVASAEEELMAARDAYNAVRVAAELEPVD